MIVWCKFNQYKFSGLDERGYWNTNGNFLKTALFWFRVPQNEYFQRKIKINICTITIMSSSKRESKIITYRLTFIFIAKININVS